MALFDKLNSLAKNIGEKATDAIETGKLTAKISSERNAAGEELKKIGEYYYNIFIAGGETAPEVLEFCWDAKTHYDAAAEAQAEIDRIRAENEAEKAAEAAAQAQPAPEGITCPGCGTVNNTGTKFCQNCGTRLEEAPVSADITCPECGEQNPSGGKFCQNCGAQL